MRRCCESGPGSYTGLRIGVSAAKGLCLLLGIPLLAIDFEGISFAS
jgi:tRNA A37 threonylcarbamoyladenosine modification protein TsaB